MYEMKIGVYELVFITPVCTGGRTLRWSSLAMLAVDRFAVVGRTLRCS